MFSSCRKDYPSIHDLLEQDLDDNSSLKKMLLLIENKKTVLEFGCATGYFSKLLLARECEVTGIEINSDAAKVAEQYCKQVIITDLDSISLNTLFHGQEFDVAVFGDVLEHLRNPWKILEETRRFIKPNGYIVASIPNIAHGAIRLALFKGEFKYTRLGILDDTHLRFFTRETVEELFEETGYKIDSVERTKLPIFCNSNLVPQFSENDFHQEIVDQIKQDSESETLQFVVRASPSISEGRYELLNNRYQKASSELEKLQSELKRTQAINIGNQLEIDQNKSEICQLKNTILSIQSSKFWKMRTAWFQLKQFMKIYKP
jgi:O-antigen biosynthesis protein